MTLIRHILPLWLSLLVALTAQAAAVAHAAPAPSGRMEICAGGGPVMVYVDAEGQPMGDPVYCPDFALSLILSLDMPEVAPVAQPWREGRIAGGIAPVSVTMSDAVRPVARGPPVPV